MPLPPLDDTICAISTAPGSGAVGIVRVSGPDAYRVADAVFRPASGRRPSELPANRVAFGRVVDAGRRAPAGAPDAAPAAATAAGAGIRPADGEAVGAEGGAAGEATVVAGDEVIDEAVLLTFRAPRSYTGQDVVEIQTHGGPAALRRVLDLCRERGARLAGPGEYTLRAYLNGRMDLVQAESVLAMVEARSEAARRGAALGLSRALTGRLDALQTRLTRVFGDLQAVVDYPEEGVPDSEFRTPLREAAAEMDRLLATAGASRLARRGARLALVGRPNAGKSSLLNALLGFERSIVSDAPGTTRDYLEAPLEIGGIPVTAIDTAGIRATADRIEAAGVARARELADAADLALVLVDRSAPLTGDDRELLRAVAPERALLVASKADLPAAWGPGAPAAAGWRGAPPLELAVGEGAAPEALDRLREAVAARLLGDAAQEEYWIASDRHAEALAEARDAAARAAEAPDDLAALDVEEALRALARITGRGEMAEEALEHVFANFCVGK